MAGDDGLTSAVVNARFVLGEALEAAEGVSSRCGDPKRFSMPSWEEWFALTNAARQAWRLLADHDKA